MIAETWPEQIRFIRSIKGAAASILWVLILSGRACTNEDLQLATNYSDKPIKDGLSLLEAEGLVQYNGKFNGWSLAGGFYQLPLPFHQLVAGVALLDIRADENESAALPVAVGADFDCEDRNISDLLLSSSSNRDQEKIVKEEEGEKKADETRKNSEIRGRWLRRGCRFRRVMWHWCRSRILVLLLFLFWPGASPGPFFMLKCFKMEH